MGRRRSAPGVDDLRVALGNRDLPILAIDVYDGPGFQSGNMTVPAPSENRLFSHAVAVVGYDDFRRRFKFANSWGTQWGEAGYGYLSYDFISQGHAPEAWLMTDQPNVFPAGTPTLTATPAGTATGGATVTLSSRLPAATSEATVKLSTAVAMLTDDKIVITFPAGFDVAEATLVSKTGFDGVASVTVQDQRVVVARVPSLNTIAGVGSKRIVLGGIRNPALPGVTEAFTIQHTDAFENAREGPVSAPGILIDASAPTPLPTAVPNPTAPPAPSPTSGPPLEPTPTPPPGPTNTPVPGATQTLIPTPPRRRVPPTHRSRAPRRRPSPPPPPRRLQPIHRPPAL